MSMQRKGIDKKGGKNIMKGFKIFNPDWTCRNYQYEVGKTYRHEGKIELCESGFHFCTNPVDLFNYYDFNPKNKVAEIEALGEVLSNSKSDSKCVTNKIKIIREIKWEEVLRLVNTGHGNSGYGNSGHGNSGHGNSGNEKSG